MEYLDKYARLISDEGQSNDVHTIDETSLYFRYSISRKTYVMPGKSAPTGFNYFKEWVTLSDVTNKC